MKKRNIEPTIESALADTPVIYINGARQTGKSTLTQMLRSGSLQYVSLDDATALSSAQSDPTAFIQSLQFPVIVDEIQRAPELFAAIKQDVDLNRKPGRYLLTGSANVLLLPRLSDSLAGRMEIVTLWPFSQGEIENTKENFLDNAFSKKFSFLTQTLSLSRAELMGKIVAGGYPEIQTRPTDDRRTAWFGSYITTIIQRDIRDLARIEGLSTLPRLLALLAARSSSILNIAELSNSAAIPQTTLKRYMTLLETTYLIQLIPAWTTNRGKRLIRSPKIVLTDTGVMAYLLGAGISVLENTPSIWGQMLETFVFMELRKQCGWSDAKPSLFHFRTLRGEEVDIVLEDRDGSVVGVEVKASSTITDSDFKNLRLLAADAKNKFRRGIILHTGKTAVPFGEKFFALPIQHLWTGLY